MAVTATYRAPSGKKSGRFFGSEFSLPFKVPSSVPYPYRVRTRYKNSLATQENREHGRINRQESNHSTLLSLKRIFGKTHCCHCFEHNSSQSSLSWSQLNNHVRLDSRGMRKCNCKPIPSHTRRSKTSPPSLCESTPGSRSQLGMHLCPQIHEAVEQWEGRLGSIRQGLSI